MSTHIASSSEKETAVVTGGASGIGRATVVRLARDGFRVIALDRNAEAVARLKDAQELSGLEVVGCAADVCDRAAICKVLDEQPQLDVMVCAAGIGKSLAFDDITEDDFREVLEVNLIGLFIGAQESARRMKAGGRIITISSRGALGVAGYAHYVSSKAAVIGLTRAMAIDLRSRSIAINSVAPGFTDTNLTRSLTPEQYAKLSEQEPNGRAADPSYIANAVAFLASRETQFMTGQTLFVDGGKSIGLVHI